MNNLTEAITNDDLVARFQKYGQIKKVNKKNHYAFITYNDRGAAEAAETAENQQILKDAQMDVQIHVPLSGVAKRMVQTIKGIYHIRILSCCLAKIGIINLGVENVHRNTRTCC